MIEDYKDKVICEDVRAVLKDLPDESIDCVLTSPPFYGLRDYQIEPEIWDEDDGKCEFGGAKTGDFNLKRGKSMMVKLKDLDLDKNYIVDIYIRNGNLFIRFPFKNKDVAIGSFEAMKRSGKENQKTGKRSFLMKIDKETLMGLVPEWKEQCGDYEAGRNRCRDEMLENIENFLKEVRLCRSEDIQGSM